MCYDCGCGIPDETHGKGNVFRGGGALTNDDFAHMARKLGITVREVKENIDDMLDKELEPGGEAPEGEEAEDNESY